MLASNRDCGTRQRYLSRGMLGKAVGFTLAAALPFLLPGIARSADVTVAVFASPLGQVMKKAVIAPFHNESHLDIAVDNRPFGVGVVRAKILSGGNVWDVVTVQAVESLQGCTEGYFAKINKARLPNLAHSALMDDRFKCGVPFIYYSTVLGYNKKQLKGEPKSWADFWDTKKWPGKRAINRTPQDALEIALLADGVARNDIYKVLSTPEGVNRAFKKLDQLKPNIVWWTNPGQSRQMLSSGEVAMSTTYDNGIVYFNQSQGTDFGYVRKDAIMHINYYAIIAGTKHLDNAYSFLNYATKAKTEAAISNGLAIAVPNRDALKYAKADLKPFLIESAKGSKTSLKSNAEFWLDNFDAIARRFNAWVSKN